jgi:hypothetical protein
MKKLWGILLSMSLVLALLLPITASAEVRPSPDVPTKATITGVGSPPEIKYQWELPDDADPTHTLPGTQVAIVPSDDPGPKEVQAYIVVTDPNGRDDISRAFADVYYPAQPLTVTAIDTAADTVTVAPVPADKSEVDITYPVEDGTEGVTGPWVTEDFIADGVTDTFELEGDMDADATIANVTATEKPFKFQVEAVKLDPTADAAIIEKAKADAVAAGLITQAEADDIDEEIYNTETAFMFKATFYMSYHQPAGWYKVATWATDQVGGQSDHLISMFQWWPTKVLDLDFTLIDFGEIMPCKEKMVPGDYVMETPGPAPPVMPTVKNEGNVDITIGLHFTAMVGDEKGKTIEDFDAKFKDEKLLFKACDTKLFTNPLYLCETEKISFSIHAPEGTPADTYWGMLHILIDP